jgi:hypothetical protein
MLGILFDAVTVKEVELLADTLEQFPVQFDPTPV